MVMKPSSVGASAGTAAGPEAAVLPAGFAFKSLNLGMAPTAPSEQSPEHAPEGMSQQDYDSLRREEAESEAKERSRQEEGEQLLLT